MSLNLEQKRKDRIEQRLAAPWSRWAQDHPRLAEAIDRTSLVENTVARVRSDPNFQEAMAQSHGDVRALELGGRLSEQLDKLIDKTLPF